MDPFRVQESGDKRLRLGRSKQLEWVESSFVTPDISDEHAVRYSQTDGYIGTVLTRRQMRQFAVGVILIFFALLFRAGYLQVAQGAYYQQLADANRLRVAPIRSDRGLVYDRFHTPLVRNVPNYTVTIRPSVLPSDKEKRQKLLASLYQTRLGTYLGQSEEQFIALVETLRSSRASYDKDTLLAEYLTQDDAILLQIEAQSIAALSVDRISRREYLNEGPVGGQRDDTQVYEPVQSLSHLLGYMTRLQPGEYDDLSTKGYLYNDSIGRTGLESFYEETLRGQFGSRDMEVDAQGQFKQVLNVQAPVDGANLITSLDLEFQRAVEAILRKHLQAAGKTAGSVVILDPNTGEVLALVSVPTYDSNLFSKGIDTATFAELINGASQPMFPRAVAGEYPSGSIFKPIVAAAALQEGVVTPRTTFTSVGGIRINEWFFPDWRAGGHGATDVYRALADSVNTYFYIVGGGYQQFEGLGVDRLTAYARQFGLAQATGIDLPGEASGFLPSKQWKEEIKKESWYIGDTYHLAIGQGDLLVTPLQMAQVIATFANGGTVYKPHLVTSIVDASLNPLQTMAPAVVSTDMVSDAHLQTVQQGLRQVVTRGSGQRLSDLPVDVAGKTGTAQWHSSRDPHAWFVGYAPYRAPTIAFSVLVEEGGEGSGIAVSIAHDLLAWWAQNRTGGGR
ncbi:MAG: penicillin-binding protein 2 [Parcubacteria group bacterium]|nr:penicillin-binding protein 2 [Parcubacteria group bacterium]